MTIAYCAKGSISVVSLLSHILISISITTAQRQRCYGTTGNFTTIQVQNRNLSLSYLASNIVANGGFYINVTIGQDPNKVYAHAICRGDSSPTDCSSCVYSTSQDLISKCPVQNEAFSWGTGNPPCVVHYANRSFFGQLELDPFEAYNNTGYNSWDWVEYYEIWSNLMDRVVRKASMGSSMLKYGTEEANYSLLGNIYALMQCTPDLSQRDCENCLRSSVAHYESCCKGTQGGVVVRPNCYFRWELYSFYTPMPDAPPPPMKGRIRTWIIVVITVSAFLVAMLLGCSLWHMWRKLEGDKEKKGISQEMLLINMAEGTIGDGHLNENLLEKQVKFQEFPQVELSLILKATQDFSNENKLGEGGFGPVYKGTLVHGKEIAVKRLSRTSGQGLQEFKNEVSLIAKLQHKNLVKLLGCCLEGNELLLIYEYMPNKSLDVPLFDSTKSKQLDWKRRLSIINGIARGVLYMHEDSRLKIIHRDLKTSNVLLDHEMNPKISDFGLARIFGGNQTEANTNRVVGTYGYMAPEYAMKGLFSVKSDVFSFGVLLLEIISGQKNDRFHSLLNFAWKLWCEGQGLELIDPVIVQSFMVVEVLKCIHIGLLCVQEDPIDRPTMSLVVVMLGSDAVTLPQPTQPALSAGLYVASRAESSSNIKVCSVNEFTLSNVSPR